MLEQFPSDQQCTKTIALAGPIEQKRMPTHDGRYGLMATPTGSANKKWSTSFMKIKRDDSIEECTLNDASTRRRSAGMPLWALFALVACSLFGANLALAQSTNTCYTENGHWYKYRMQSNVIGWGPNGVYYPTREPLGEVGWPARMAGYCAGATNSSSQLYCRPACAAIPKYVDGGTGSSVFVHFRYTGIGPIGGVSCGTNGTLYNGCTSCGFKEPMNDPVTQCPANPPIPPVYTQDPCEPSPLGNPCFPGTGTKRLDETDYAGVIGLVFGRSYSNFRTYASGSAPINPAFGAPSWLHTYERSMHVDGSSASGGVKWISQRQDGSLLHFRADGTEILNRSDTGAASTVTALPNVTGWELRLASGDVERYNNGGQLVSITDRKGVVTSIQYGSNQRISRVVNSFGHDLDFFYNGQNRLSIVRNPAGSDIQFAYDANGRLETVTYPDLSVRRYHYEDVNPILLTGVTDEISVRFATYLYDAQGRVISSEHAGGAGRYEFLYSGSSAPFSTVVEDPLGTSRTYTIGTVNNVYKLQNISGPTCNACGRSQQVAYDANGNISQRTDFAGNVTTYSFNSPRNLETSRTEAYLTADARTITTQWHANFRLPTLITQSGRTTAFTYDANGNQLTKTITDTATSATRTWTSTYDSYGRMLTADGPRTDVTDLTTYAYYSCTTGYQCGQLQTITDAAFRVTTFNTYNAHGQPLTITDPNGVATTLAYDTRQRLTSRTIGSEATTSEYWPTGLLKKVTLPDSSYLLYSYDAAHRLTRIDDGASDYIVYTLDAMGNRMAENVFDPTSYLTRTHSRVYNSLNQLWKDLTAAGTTAQTTVFGYDLNGNLTTINAPLTRNTTNQYDALNRLKQVTDPASGITQFGYDATDNLTSVTDPRAKVTSYTYTGFGDLKTQTSPDTGLTTNTYDSGGNLQTSTDARNAITTYTLDALNRVTSAAFKIGSTTDQTISFGYDAGTNGIGRLTSASDASHSMSWSYDAQGHVTSKGQTVGTVTKTVGYGYTNCNLTSMTTPSGQAVVYGYNLNHQVTSVSVNGTTVLSSALYDPFGPVRGWTWGNATIAVRTFDLDGKTTQVDSAGLKTYAYDDAFRITGITDTVTPANSYAYGYNSLDGLTSAVKTGTTRGWTYDANGNRLTETVASASTYTIASTNNRISSITGALPRTYSYDTAGNVLSYAAITATYNNRGRMKTLTNGASTETIVWNALGQRVKVSGGTPGTVLYVYDESGHILGEYTSTGALVQETIWMGDTPIATIRPGTPVLIFYVHADHLDTPRRVSRPSDNKLMWTWYSDPFGADLPNENPAGDGTFKYNLRFPGQLYDSHAGLNYNYFRDYDPQVGRYVESDPVGLGGGINTYAYAGDNPVWFLDPLGLKVLNPKGYPVSPDVLDALWDLNRLSGCDKDIVITGGDRPRDNKIGSRGNSTHVKGLAADIYVPGQLHLVTANQAIKSGLFGGVGWYEEGYRGLGGEGPHTHVDLRKKKPDGRLYLWGYRANGAYGTIPPYDVELNQNNCGCER